MDHSSSSDSPFSQDYKLLKSISYNVRNQNNSKTFIPPAKSDVDQCCICKRTSPDVEFKMESHIIPAFFGNRIFFSREECDSCNQTLGQLLEQELSKMTLPMRQFFQIPTRGKPPKAVSSDNHTILYDSVQGLVIHAPSGESYSNESTGIVIESNTPSYRPFRAIRSILKSAYLAMTYEHREKHPSLLEYVKKSDLTTPFFYYTRAETRKNPDNVELSIYERTGAADLPDLFVHFSFANFSIFWASPLKSTGKFIDLGTSWSNHNFNAESQVIYPDQDTKESRKLKMMFSRSETKHKKKFDSFYHSGLERGIFSMHVSAGEVHRNISPFYGKILNKGSSSPKIALSSKSFPCRFTLTFLDFPRELDLKLKADFRPSGFGCFAVKTAFEFMDLVHTEGAELRISGQIFPSPLSVFSTDNLPFEALNYERYVNSLLVSISEFENRELCHPTILRKEDLHFLEQYHAVINQISDPDLTGNLTINASGTFPEMAPGTQIELRAGTVSFVVGKLLHEIPAHSIYFSTRENPVVIESGEKLKMRVPFKGIEFKRRPHEIANKN